MSRPTVAVLRPDDNRIAEAVEYLQSLDVSPIPDPMLTIEPIDRVPQHADYCVFTSETGVELVATAGWEQRETTICAVESRLQPHYAIKAIQSVSFHRRSHLQDSSTS